MSKLFTPITLRGITCRNRIFVSPMCQYSSRDGMPKTGISSISGAVPWGGPASSWWRRRR